jgi:hypothetical protein
MHPLDIVQGWRVRVRLSVVLAVLVGVLMALAVLSGLYALSDRRMGADEGDPPMDLDLMYTFLALGGIIMAPYMLAEAREQKGWTSPQYLGQMSDSHPGEVNRTTVKDEEVRRANGGKW